MSRFARLTLVAVAGLAGGCRATPVLNGGSLACTASCPGELRCIGGDCVQNSPPVVLPLAPRQVVVGTPIAIDPGDPINDADGDPYRFVWTQIQGPVAAFTGEVTIGPPGALAETATDGPLALTLVAVGLYVFEVRGDDGFDPGQPQKLAVTATNSPPTIAGIADTYVVQGDPVDLTVAGTDADGHAISFAWQQLGGPLVTLPAGGAELSFVAAELGLYAFEVTASDAYATSAPTSVRVISQPEPDAVYVSSAGLDIGTGACGSLDAPCPTLADGIAAMRALAGVRTVMIAAADRPYGGCLDLDAGERVYGAFDPRFWQRDSALRGATRIECDDPNGHRVNDTNADGTMLADVVLGSSVANSPSLVVTLATDAGNPTVRDVDIETATCGPSCSVVGVMSSGASPHLIDVDIHAAAGGIVRVGSFVGLLAVGGHPTISGTAGSRSPGDAERATITLDASADDEAFGVVAGGSVIVLDRIAIRGGLAPVLGGVWGLDSNVALSGVVIELTSFGTTFMGGVSVMPCPPSESRCACSGVAGGCAATEPSLSISGGSVELRGSQRVDGYAPCLGIGIQGTDARTMQVSGGATVQLAGAFHFGIGALVQPLAAGVAAITDSTIALADGFESQVCETQVAPVALQPFGNVGVFVTAGTGVQVARNTVTVGTHDTVSVGLRVTGVTDATIEDNRIRVEATGVDIGGVGIGAALEASDLGGTGYSLFARNRVRMGAGVIEGYAASLPANSPWWVRNNYLSGGDALYGAGIVLGNLGAEWPKLYYNTVVGSESRASLTSRAVLLFGGANVLADPVEVFGNLLDAGEGRGQRLILDNWADIGLPKSAGIPAGPLNLGQIVPPAGQNAAPAFVFSSALIDAGNSGITPLAAKSAMHVLMEGRGEILGFDTVSAASTLEPPVQLRGVPVAGAVWSGVSKGIESLVIVLEPTPGGPGLIGVAELRGRFVRPIKRYVVRSIDGAVRRPRFAVGSRAAKGQPLDLFFIENRGTASTDGLWVMRAASGRGYLPAELVAPLDQPSFLDVLLGGTVLVVAADATGEPMIFGFRPEDLGSPLGFPVNIGTYVSPAPAQVSDIDQVVSTSFAEESSATPYGDSVMLFAGEIHAVLTSSETTLAEAGGLTSVCAGLGAPEAFAVGPVFDGPGGETTPYELVVACNTATTGTLRICDLKTLTPPPPDFTCGADIGTGGPVASVAIERRANSAWTFISDLSVNHFDVAFGPQIEIFQVDPATDMANLGPSYPPSAIPVSLLANVVARDPTSHVPQAVWPPGWEPTFLDIHGVGATDQCELEFRTSAPPGDPPDLGLTAAATACIDQVAWWTGDPDWWFTDDIDGDPRPDQSGSLLDFGADEY